MPTDEVVPESGDGRPPRKPPRAQDGSTYLHVPEAPGPVDDEEFLHQVSVRGGRRGRNGIGISIPTAGDGDRERPHSPPPGTAARGPRCRASVGQQLRQRWAAGLLRASAGPTERLHAKPPYWDHKAQKVYLKYEI